MHPQAAPEFCPGLPSGRSERRALTKLPYFSGEELGQARLIRLQKKWRRLQDLQEYWPLLQK
jgi:hypothetical protein